MTAANSAEPVAASIGSDTQSRSELWVTCKPCGHTWVAAYLPMEMRKVATLMEKLHCPKCGEGNKQLFMSSEADIVAASHRQAADTGRV